MFHQEKNQRLLEGHHHYSNDMVMATDSDYAVTFDDLADVLPNVLGYLILQDIMHSRRINKKLREAVKRTIVPVSKFSGGNFFVNSMKRYNAMRVMTTELPNLQQLSLSSLGVNDKWIDGEDPHVIVNNNTDWISHDIEIISNFSKLKILNFRHITLNGRYPFLFNSFPLLQKLSITNCHALKWDLEVLAGLPLLKELDCGYNPPLTGNISTLRVLKATLQKVDLHGCCQVEGNFMDLADFPFLKKLNLYGTAVTGDVRDIGENDISVLDYLRLPKGVYGGMGYEFQHISDAPELIGAVYLFTKQRPALDIDHWCSTLSRLNRWYGKLSENSPDWYDAVADNQYYFPTPFCIRFIQAGSRVGYRWETRHDGTDYHSYCEVNWLDPEPDRDSGDYEGYIEELRAIEANVKFYRGFHQPPTQEEYHRLVEEHRRR
jgi:hypothetical protein